MAVVRVPIEAMVGVFVGEVVEIVGRSGLLIATSSTEMLDEEESRPTNDSRLANGILGLAVSRSKGGGVRSVFASSSSSRGKSRESLHRLAIGFVVALAMASGVVEIVVSAVVSNSGIIGVEVISTERAPLSGGFVAATGEEGETGGVGPIGTPIIAWARVDDPTEDHRFLVGGRLSGMGPPSTLSATTSSLPVGSRVDEGGC